VAVYFTRLPWVTVHLDVPSSPSSSASAQSNLGGTHRLVLAYLDRHHGDWRDPGDLAGPAAEKRPVGFDSVPAARLVTRRHPFGGRPEPVFGLLHLGFSGVGGFYIL